MKKLVCAFALLLAVFSTVSGEESWEGNAAVIRGGELDHSGLYAVSNSFTKYSKIVITNLENGKKAAVTVLDRIPETSNMFLLLSRDAAKELGMSISDISRVTVTMSNEPGVVTVGIPDDLAYNPDPDVNPAVLIPEEKKVEQPEKAEQTKSVKAAKEDKNSSIIEYLSERSPKKDLFKKPEKRESLTLIEKPKTPESEKASINLKLETSGEELKKQIQIADVVGKPSVTEEEKPSMKLPGLESPGVEIPVEQKAPEKGGEGKVEISETPAQPKVSETPKQEKSTKPSASTAIVKPGIVKLTLKPTEPKPPSSASETPTIKKAAEKVSAAVKKPGAVRTLSGMELPKKSYFLQLGSYSSLILAEKLASGLKGTYPVTLLHSQGGKHILYKVLIGPLNKEESGTLLFWFRARGFKDSFLRYID